MGKDNAVLEKAEESSVWQHEDAALKSSMKFFAEELLPYLGIEGNVVSFAPTELVHLELKKMNQDFNVVMEDGTWKHFEFQSTNEGLDGLKRFRTYEALTSYQHKVEVTTYVLFSGMIRNPMTEYTEGINTYRIEPIVMRGYDGDGLLGELQKKMNCGKKFEKEELIPLALCPLMGGSMSQKERIRTAFSITSNADAVDPQIIKQMEAVIYAMADKFLSREEMEQIKEEIKMTQLGRMLVEDGIAQGMEQGVVRGAEAARLESARNLIDILSEETIAARIGVSIEKVIELKREKQAEK